MSGNDESERNSRRAREWEGMVQPGLSSEYFSQQARQAERDAVETIQHRARQAGSSSYQEMLNRYSGELRAEGTRTGRMTSHEPSVQNFIPYIESSQAFQASQVHEATSLGAYQYVFPRTQLEENPWLTQENRLEERPNIPSFMGMDLVADRHLHDDVLYATNRQGRSTGHLIPRDMRQNDRGIFDFVLRIRSEMMRNYGARPDRLLMSYNNLSRLEKMIRQKWAPPLELSELGKRFEDLMDVALQDLAERVA